MISVTKKVIGYGKSPTDCSKVYKPINGSLISIWKNFWKIRLHETREATKIPVRIRYNRSCQILFCSDFNVMDFQHNHALTRLKYTPIYKDGKIQKLIVISWAAYFKTAKLFTILMIHHG